MCKQNISLRKFLKLIFEILFYNIVITLIFFLAGYEPFSWKQFINGLLLVRNIGTGFTSAFIIFYLFIPFLNILIKNLNERKHLALIVLTICTYSIIATIPKFNVTFNYVSWFIVLYFISSFIRMYPKKLWFNKKIWWISSIVLIFICILSILLMTYISSRYDKFVVFRFVSDSNQFLALLTAICTFMAFKNLNIRNSKIINTIAASTFGVLLIHANSDIMRKWLWKDTLNNCDAYYLEGGALYYIQYCQ